MSEAKSVTKKELKEFFYNVESTYKSCWDVLEGLDKSSLKINSFTNFQAELARSLLEISNLYKRISLSKKELIIKKDSYSEDWFSSKMNSIKKIQNSLRELSAIGKVLGDCFTWIFYNSSRDLLSRHYENPVQKMMPSGIGGLGEVSFIENVKVLNNHLVIFHGITSYLRLGDFSFFDLKEQKIVATAELKTKKSSKNTLDLKLVTVAKQKESLDFIVDQNEKAPKNYLHFEKESNSEFQKKIELKLNKQLKKIGQIEDDIVPDRKLNFERSDKTNKYSELYYSIQKKKAVFEVLSDDLAIFGIKIFQRSLYKKFNQGTEYLKIQIEKMAKELEKSVDSIILKDSIYNSFLIGYPFNFDENYNLEYGMSPIFFRFSNKSLVRDIIFRDVIFVTVYNPAHFLETLIEKGFSIKKTVNGKGYEVTKKLSFGVVKIEGLMNLMRLIPKSNFSKDEVLDLIERTIEVATKNKQKGDIIVNMDIRSYN